MITKMFIGLGIIILAIVLFVNPIFVINLLDSGGYQKLLVNYTGNATTFIFEKTYIKDYYQNTDSGREYVTFLDIYLEDILNGNGNITYARINDNYYFPENLSYRYSFVIDEGVLNENNQELFVEANNITIDSAELLYFGADYENNSLYMTASFSLSILLFIFGALLLLI